MKLTSFNQNIVGASTKLRIVPYFHFAEQLAGIQEGGNLDPESTECTKNGDCSLSGRKEKVSFIVFLPHNKSKLKISDLIRPTSPYYARPSIRFNIGKRPRRICQVTAADDANGTSAEEERLFCGTFAGDYLYA